MKQCFVFVTNYLFLWHFQHYKALRFSKLTLSQMRNKTEQQCLWYYFFHLICIHCIHVAGSPSVFLWYCLLFCFTFFVRFLCGLVWFGVFFQTHLFSSLRCMISARSGSPTSFPTWSFPWTALISTHGIYILLILPFPPGAGGKKRRDWVSCCMILSYRLCLKITLIFFYHPKNNRGESV